MTVLWLDGSRPCATWAPAPCPAWPRLFDLDERGRNKRDCSWSVNDARRHCEGKPAPKTLRGGIEYVDDPEAATMAHPLGTVSLFR